jgi:Fibronectin type III domain
VLDLRIRGLGVRVPPSAPLRPPGIPTSTVTVLLMISPLRNMRLPKLLVLLALGSTLTLVVSPVAYASKSTPRPNAACSTVNQRVRSAGTVLRCEVSLRGNKVWRVLGTAPLTAMRKKTNSVLQRTTETLTTSTRTNLTHHEFTSQAADSIALSPTATSTTTEAAALLESSPFGDESRYPVLPDPDNGGSPEVVIIEPAMTERPNPALPARVEGFELVALGETSASFTLVPRDGVSQYQVYVRYDDSFTLKGIDVSHPTVTFTDLSPDWSYTACAYYNIDSIESEKSCIDFRTNGSRPSAPAAVAGPSSITATATETTISMNWSPVSGAAWYSICHLREDSMQCGGYTMLSDTSAIFQDGSISAGWDYTITIQAVFGDGSRSLESRASVRSLGSRPIPTTRLAGVTNFRVVSVTPTTARVVWEYTDSSTLTAWSVTARHLTSYTSTGVDSSAREFTISNLAPGLGYEITIQGRNDSRETEVASTNVLMPNA